MAVVVLLLALHVFVYSTFFSPVLATVLDISVSCDRTNFYLRVHFDRLFRGLIYSERGFPNCIYVNGTVQAQTSYEIKVPLVGCSTERDSSGHLVNSVIVQENSAYLQISDRKYLLTCIPSVANSRDEAMTVKFGGVTVDSSQSTTELVVAHATAQPVDYTVEIRQGHGDKTQSITGPLAVGDPISYVVRVEKPGSRIGRCWATDTHSELQLSDEKGCSVQETGSVWGDFQRRQGDDGRVYFQNEIKAWAFPTSNEVNIFCNLHVCVSGGTCTQPSCIKRSRRQHDEEREIENDGQLEVMEARLRVTRSFQSPVTVGSAAVLALLIVVAVATLLLISSRTKSVTSSSDQQQ